MFNEKKVDWNVFASLCAMYGGANNFHFKNSNEQKARNYEEELIGFIRKNAQQSVPFISKEKQLKIQTKNIATEAFNNFALFSKKGFYKEAREQITQGINSIVKIVLGETLFEEIELSYKTALILVKNPLDEMNEEEKLIFLAVTDALKNKVLKTGLVKA